VDGDDQAALAEQHRRVRGHLLASAESSGIMT